MLVEIAYKTQGKVTDCDMVLTASKKYRGSQDYMGKFFDDNIIKDDTKGVTLKWSFVWGAFKEWYVENGYGRNIPKHGEFKNFMEKKLGIYPKNRMASL